MADVARRIESARAHIEPAWHAERAERLRASVMLGVARSRRRRAAWSVTLAAAALGIALLAFRRAEPQRATLESAAVTRLVSLEDGSAVTPRSAGARVQTVEVGREAVTLRLESGAARFEVAPNATRPFRVLARDVTVTVLGTVFEVGLEADGVRVTVERGRVRTSSATGTRELGAGESALLGSTPADVKSGAPAIEPAPAAVPISPESLRAPPAAAPRSWRLLAEEGNFTAALARLAAEGSGAVRDTPDDLLLAADVARQGGRPERAIEPLQRLIAKHPFDPRAPLAAFTLGRTLLENLGRPREAAQAFSTARRLDRASALTQDALAREVESWSRAGESALAQERAREYLKLYPNGRRAGAVRRLGGLD